MVSLLKRWLAGTYQGAVGQEHQAPPEILVIDSTAAEWKSEKLRRLRSRRDGGRANSPLDSLAKAAENRTNLMPYILECVRAYATVGEICNRLRAVLAVYEETSVI